MLCYETEPKPIRDWKLALEVSRDKQKEAEFEAASLLRMGQLDQARIATTAAVAYEKAAFKFEKYLREVNAQLAAVEPEIFNIVRSQPDRSSFFN